MPEHLLQRAAELLAQGETFAMATVVRCQPPSSGKPGDKAIILADGKLSGWIGGGCAQPVVIREALRALSEGKPRLVRISPSASDEEGVVEYAMTCHSGGELDIYIEPVAPNLHLVILGRSQVARTLARLGGDIGYAVSVVVPTEDTEGFTGAEVIYERHFDLSRIRIKPQTYVVVSTQGEGDEEALEQAALTASKGAAYISFVASRTKAAKALDYLRERGVPQEKLQLVRAPAGLNLGASSPEEIAVSILAEIVQVRRAQATSAQQRSAAKEVLPANTEARDPVCGMPVDTTGAVLKSEYQGKWFYFCSAGCKRKFEEMA